MGQRGLSYVLKSIDVVMVLGLIALALFYVPSLASYLFNFHPGGPVNLSDLNVFAWRVVLCGWGYIALCLGVWVLMWHVCSAMRRGQMFTDRTARRFRLAFAFMLVASAVALVAAAWLFRWSLTTNGSTLLGVRVLVLPCSALSLHWLYSQRSIVSRERLRP